MKSPFDEVDQHFFVLVNDEMQHSLWPEFAAIPNGWKVVFGPENKESCKHYVDKSWPDLLPKRIDIVAK
jgi:MbtH protein